MTNLATQIRAAVEGDKHTYYTELLLQAAELLDHKDTQINTRTATPVDGLETWKFHAPLNGSSKMIQSNHGEWVPRSQAEAIIAAKDKQIEAYGLALMMIGEGCGNPSFVARNVLERFGK